MIARALSLALAFCLALTARGLTQEKLNPMRHVAAYSAADGVQIAGQKEEDTQAGLVAAAKTFVVLPKPLTQPQIKELCSQKQP